MKHSAGVTRAGAHAPTGRRLWWQPRTGPAPDQARAPGDSGGPAWLDGDRCGPSSALIHRDRLYLVDLGAGAQQRLVGSGLGVRSGYSGRLIVGEDLLQLPVGRPQ
ncbi:hypothetical protein [Streptomyces sp. ISL-100]|uniref:hypothetical protein n=1 Tax=Streptomyces sp. ISL-100 TaxID=2819173 RepID=UPI001BEC666D|nr:hypothetical protein [Streptomyces sp. ISL-100]MBT2394524.1 hypothetical protein [Streptomyces sp. ISL-100]